MRRELHRTALRRLAVPSRAPGSTTTSLKALPAFCYREKNLLFIGRPAANQRSAIIYALVVYGERNGEIRARACATCSEANQLRSDPS